MNKLIQRSLYTGLLFLISSFTFAQHYINFNVKNTDPKHFKDSVFVAGNFNNWSPDKTPLTFSASDNTWKLQLHNLKDDVYQFKFTRGSWNSVEATVNGIDVTNHSITLSSDTIFNYSIAAWKDDFATTAKQHTASSNVSVIDTAFYMPQLDRKRRIWIYLPAGYSDSKKHYPVMYMHDGQNLFDEFTSGFGEWGVDECLDSLQQQTKNACIVVGIDNGPKRLNEYSPYDNDRFGKGEGKEYVNFLVKTLKPFIDKHYRTISSAQNTIIAGSSMGGLISYYAAIVYPDVFGKAGIFSPSFWIAPQMLQLTDSIGKNLKGKYFFYIGEKEGEKEVQDMKDITDKLGEVSDGLVYSQTDPDGSHNEQAWRKWFAQFYKWIMSDWTNYIIKQGD